MHQHQLTNGLWQAALLCLVAVHHANGADFKPFIAYGASADSQELVAVRFHQQDGTVTSQVVQREPLECEGAPVLYHKQHQTLYVASLRAQDGEQNQLVIFSVANDGRLTRRQIIPMQHGSAYASFDRSGQFLLTTSYFEGYVDVYRLGDHGLSVSPASTTFEGRDKAHSILLSPDNRFAYVPYVKDNNGMFQYQFDSKSGRLNPLQPKQADVPDGIGPRHVAFHPTKPFVFFSNEQQLGATSYRIGQDGRLSLVCVAGKLKAEEGLDASDVEITHDGRFLFVGVRDFAGGKRDSVHRYSIQPNGMLTHLGQVSTDPIPWGLHTAPDRQHLLITAAHGETLTMFEIDNAGGLTKNAAVKWGRMVRDIAVLELD
ncbi:MAG: lactonase family protein [Fuerstiella sp.]|nr:lactonase family protein [Fuerstiella sp.]